MKRFFLSFRHSGAGRDPSLLAVARKQELSRCLPQLLMDSRLRGNDEEERCQVVSLHLRWIATAFGLAMTAFLYFTPALALMVDAPLADSAAEARARHLFTELRCVVCEGEAIADSPAEVARDMRRMVREHIASGKNDEEILAALVAQYGERVLMTPMMSNRNLPLWLGPFLLLLIGGGFAWRTLFRSKP